MKENVQSSKKKKMKKKKNFQENTMKTFVFVVFRGRGEGKVEFGRRFGEVVPPLSSPNKI